MMILILHEILSSNSLLHQIKHWQSIRINYKYCTLERWGTKQRTSASSRAEYFSFSYLHFSPSLEVAGVVRKFIYLFRLMIC